MPKKAHKELEREADKKGLTGKKRQAYIYGTLKKIERRRRRKR